MFFSSFFLRSLGCDSPEAAETCEVITTRAQQSLQEIARKHKVTRTHSHAAREKPAPVPQAYTHKHTPPAPVAASAPVTKRATQAKRVKVNNRDTRFKPLRIQAVLHRPGKESLIPLCAKGDSGGRREYVYPRREEPSQLQFAYEGGQTRARRDEVAQMREAWEDQADLMYLTPGKLNNCWARGPAYNPIRRGPLYIESRKDDSFLERLFLGRGESYLERTVRWAEEEQRRKFQPSVFESICAWVNPLLKDRF